MPNFYNDIVQVNISQVTAPTPSKYLQSAAFVSVGATTSTIPAAGYTLTEINAPGELAPLLVTPNAITGVSWALGVLTITLGTSFAFTVGDTVPVYLSGNGPTGSTALNGYFVATVGAGGTTLTVSVATDPTATWTTFGTVVSAFQQSLIAFDATWWANGLTASYQIFEVGPLAAASSSLSGTASVQNATLNEVNTYLSLNKGDIYAWGFPLYFDADSAMGPFLNLYTALNALQTFYIPTTAATYSTIGTLSPPPREAYVVVQSPNAAPNELDYAAYMQFLTQFNASVTNRLPPSQYKYTQNTVPYLPMNRTIWNQYLNDNINFITTGAEGGISNTMQVMGTMLDNTPGNVKYSIDWVQVEMNLAISNALINGSNTTLNPLLYNPEGINTLQAVCRTVATRAIGSGLAIGQPVLVQLDPTVFATNVANGVYRGQFAINAVPFPIYTALNPSDYSQGIYTGLQIVYTPQYGFRHIVVNLQVSMFA